MTRTIWAYGDETGDRGLSATASPIFGMAMVVGDADAMTEIRAAVKKLRSDFGVPKGEVMSWKAHLKQADRRNHAAQTLARLSGFHVIYAVTVKEALASRSFQGGDKDFYDFVAARVHRATLWASKDLHAEEVRIRFGRVRKVDHVRTADFIRRENGSDRRVPNYLVKELSWVGADEHFESEAADIYAGFMKSAFWPDKYGNVDEAYLRRVWHQVRKAPNGCAIPLGMFPMPHYGVIFDADWFWCGNCPKHSEYRQREPDLWDRLYGNR